MGVDVTKVGAVDLERLEQVVQPGLKTRNNWMRASDLRGMGERSRCLDIDQEAGRFGPAAAASGRINRSRSRLHIGCALCLGQVYEIHASHSDGSDVVCEMG